MTLPDPGLWCDPADLCCEVERGEGACCESDLAIARFATNLLVRAYGLRFSAGYERIVERISAPQGAEDHRLIPLGGAAPWPVAQVERILANGLSIPPVMWRLDPDLGRIQRLPDPFAPYGLLAATWPREHPDLAARPQAAFVGVDTEVGTATTFAVDQTAWNQWGVTLTGFTEALPACDSIVLVTSDELEYELPFDGLAGSAPTFTYTAQHRNEGGDWPASIADTLNVAQGWIAHNWADASGRPGTTPDDLTVTVYVRSYVANQAWQGPTLEVTYRAGMLPPSADLVARQLSCELRKLLCPTAESVAQCGIPAGSAIRSISRQGLNIQLDDEQVKEALLGWNSIVDAAIREYRFSNGQPTIGPVSVWAPSRSDRNAWTRW